MRKNEPIRIDELPIEGLDNLRQQLHSVLEAKKKAIDILANTANAFEQSRSSVEDLSKLNNGMPTNCVTCPHNFASPCSRCQSV